MRVIATINSTIVSFLFYCFIFQFLLASIWRVLLTVQRTIRTYVSIVSENSNYFTIILMWTRRMSGNCVQVVCRRTFNSHVAHWFHFSKHIQTNLNISNSTYNFMPEFFIIFIDWTARLCEQIVRESASSMQTQTNYIGFLLRLICDSVIAIRGEIIDSWNSETLCRKLGFCEKFQILRTRV